jgi:predicted outer membrane repeat protein
MVYFLLLIFLRFSVGRCCDNFYNITSTTVSTYSDLIDAIDCEVNNILLVNDIQVVNEILIVNQTVSITSEYSNSLISQDNRIFFILNSNVTLSNLIFHGGGEMLNGNGGLIFIENSMISLKNSTISSGKATHGGGLSFIHSDILLDQILIENNSVLDLGGGIECSHSQLIITNSLFKNNTSQSGGSIASKNCHLTLINTTLMTSTAVKNGGCLYGIELSQFFIIQTNFSSCRVELSPSQLNEVSQGGCIFGSNLILSLNDTIISNCFAAIGSAFRVTETQMTIFNSKIHHNLALSSTIEVIGASSNLSIHYSALYSNQ